MSEIDDLMELDPLNLTKQDLDAIIAHHRNTRAREEPTTGRLRKPAPKGKVDLTALVKGMVGAKAPEAPKPAPGGGLRRL